jgi:hypothetical protein
MIQKNAVVALQVQLGYCMTIGCKMCGGTQILSVCSVILSKIDHYHSYNCTKSTCTCAL